MASTVDTPNKGSGIQHDRKSWEVAFAEWLKQPGKSKKMWTSDYMKSVVAALSLNDEDVAAMEAGPEKKRVRVWRTRFALVNIAAEGSPEEYVVVRQGGEEEGKRCMHTKGGGGGTVSAAADTVFAAGGTVSAAADTLLACTVLASCLLTACCLCVPHSGRYWHQTLRQH